MVHSHGLWCIRVCWLPHRFVKAVADRSWSLGPHLAIVPVSHFLHRALSCKNHTVL